MNALNMHVAWAPEAADTAGAYSGTVTYDFRPSGGGQTLVNGGSTIHAEYTIKVSDWTWTIGGVDVTPPSSLKPSMADMFLDNTLARGAPAASKVTMNWNRNGAAPDVVVDVTHTVNAWWNGQNPDDTAPAPTANHYAAIQYFASVFLTSTKPTK